MMSLASPSMATLSPSEYMALKDLELQLSSLTLPANHVPGVYVVQDAQRPLLLQGILFASHKGPYAGGVFRFVIQWRSRSSSSQSLAPSVQFKRGLPNHPLIHPTTLLLSLAPRFPQWQPRKHTLVHLFAYLRQILDADYLGNQVAVHQGWWTNTEVGTLLRTSPKLFNKLAAQSVALSNTPSVLHDTDQGGRDQKGPHQQQQQQQQQQQSVNDPLQPDFPLPKMPDGEAASHMRQLREDIFGITTPSSSSRDSGAESLSIETLSTTSSSR